jgi:hypothetical protein
VILAKPHFSYKFHATVKKIEGGENFIHGEKWRGTGAEKN